MLVIFDDKTRNFLFFKQLLRHGGVFIIFANSRSSLETILATQGRDGLQTATSDIDNWSFLSVLDRNLFEADHSEGTEITVKEKKGDFYNFLERNIKNAYYSCTINPLSGYTKYSKYSSYESRYISNNDFKSWISIATDKYGNSVAGAFAPSEHSKGWIFIFPQIENKSAFLLEFLRDRLPELAPELFPYSENKNWLERNEYQPTIVQELNKQIQDIENIAKQNIEKISEEIQKEKEKVEYQNKLLTDNDDSLVKAVKTSLEVLGFKSVIDVDAELAEQGKTSNKIEDLQIRDKPTSILVEVKGIIGLPKDDDALQVTKHIAIRQNEWKEFGVRALTIINHQKATPGLDRQQNEVFRDYVIESAKEQNLGLMTTFDLYRLVRSFLKNGWKHENIKDLFLQSGHISIVPLHYQYVGIIENYWEQVGVVGIRVEENAIKLGDTISFELPIEFEEMNVESLEVEKVAVEVAEVSMLAGIKTNLSKEILKKGIKVFRIITPKP